MRRVGTVRLAASSEALMRRGAILLEDALRTASLPEAGPGRVLLFRTLRLEIIRADLPPSSLALALERRMRELVGSAVHAGSPTAPQEEIVFFRDDAEPSVMLAEQLARGEPASAWFWPLAVSGFHPALPRDETLRLALFTTLRTSAGPSATVRLVDTLRASGTLDTVLGALRRQEGPALIRAFRSSPPSHQLPITARLEAPAQLSSTMRSTLRPWIEGWSADDARAIWLSAVALLIERRGYLADVHLFERAALLASSLVSETKAAIPWRKRDEASSSSPLGPPTASALNESHRRQEGVASSSPSRVASMPTSELEDVALASSEAEKPGKPRVLDSNSSKLTANPAALQEPARSAEPLPSATLPSISSHTLPPAPSVDEGVTTVPASRPTRPPLEQPGTKPLRSSKPREWPETLRPTIVGGLFFLVRVLERVGIAALLSEAPSLFELDVPERLLARIAERLGAPMTDPSRVILEASIHEPPPSHAALELRLRELLAATRRWCRLRAKIGLHTLVRRPASITATRTHIDVLLDLQQADVRIRSAGLDVDPGWIPWLGRVVRFHYQHGEL